jgi:hypothetical protein
LRAQTEKPITVRGCRLSRHRVSRIHPFAAVRPFAAAPPSFFSRRPVKKKDLTYGHLELKPPTGRSALCRSWKNLVIMTSAALALMSLFQPLAT